MRSAPGLPIILSAWGVRFVFRTSPLITRNGAIKNVRRADSVQISFRCKRLDGASFWRFPIKSAAG